MKTKMEKKKEQAEIKQGVDKMEHAIAKPLPYHDMCLTCIGCGKNFDFPATEQDFFAKNKLDSPKRCRECRAKKPKNLTGKAFLSQTQEPVEPFAQPRKSAKKTEQEQIPPIEMAEPFFDPAFSAMAAFPAPMIMKLVGEIRSLRQEIFQLRNETKSLKEETSRLYKMLEEDINLQTQDYGD